MGSGYSCKCANCSYQTNLFLGIGLGYGVLQGKIEQEALMGKYGTELKDFLQENKNGSINPERVAKICEVCGHIEETYDLSIYLPKTDTEDKKWITRSSHIVFKKFSHKCSICGGAAYTVNEKDMDKGIIELHCPDCKSKLDYAGFFDWD